MPYPYDSQKKLIYRVFRIRKVPNGDWFSLEAVRYFFPPRLELEEKLQNEATRMRTSQLLGTSLILNRA